MPDRAIVALAAVALLACAHASASALAAQQLPDGLAAGRYTLAAVQGHSLPYSPVEPGRPAGAPAPEILSSTLILLADGHFRMSMAYRVKRGDAERFFDNPFTGTVLKHEDAWVMQWDDAGMTPVTWADGAVTYTNEGLAYEYRRGR